jgi:hypothetical protein
VITSSPAAVCMAAPTTSCATPCPAWDRGQLCRSRRSGLLCQGHPAQHQAHLWRDPGQSGSDRLPFEEVGAPSPGRTVSPC